MNQSYFRSDELAPNAEGRWEVETTPFSRGPWHPDFCHAGPPSALMVRAAQELGSFPSVQRATFDVLRPIPLGALIVTVRKQSDSRSLERWEVELLSAERVCMRGTILLASSNETEGLPDPAPSPLPNDSAPLEFPFNTADESYMHVVELRAARGKIGDGDMFCWLRPSASLLAGESTLRPTDRVFVCADASSGVGARLDWKTHSFVNADLSVSLFREPEGDWLGLEAKTYAGAGGRGLTSTTLFDARGPVGACMQGLAIRRVRSK